MFKKFLVPLNGSEQAGKILPYRANLANTRDSRVTQLHLYGKVVTHATVPEFLIIFDKGGAAALRVF